jgi:hypothetical protein
VQCNGSALANGGSHAWTRLYLGGFDCQCLSARGRACVRRFARTACEAADGTYVIGDGGVKTCEFPVGNSDNTKTVEQKGSFNSSLDESYVNPGGNEPAGQQGGNKLEKQ